MAPRLLPLLLLGHARAGLVAHYRFDDAAASAGFADSSGSGLHCRKVGVERGPGRRGYGADSYTSRFSVLLSQMDSNDTFVECPPWSAYWRQASRGEGATVAMWVHRRAEGVYSPSEEVLFQAPDGVKVSLVPRVGGMTLLRLRAPNGDVCQRELSAAGSTYLDGAAQLLPGRWHHVAAGSGGVPPVAALWVDGRQVASCSGVRLGDGAGSTAAVTMLGVRGSPVGFKGQVDDARVYSGLATAGLLGVAMQYAAPRPLPTTHLAAQWTFDAHSQASKVYDVSGGGRHLTSTGSPALEGPPNALRGSSALLSGSTGWSAGTVSKLRWSPGGAVTLMGWWRPKDPYGVAISGTETTETTILAAGGQTNSSDFDVRIGLKHFGAAQGMQSGAFADNDGLRCGPTTRREGRAYSADPFDVSEPSGQWFHVAGTFYKEGSAVFLQGMLRRRCVWWSLDAPYLELSGAYFLAGSTNYAGAWDNAQSSYLLDDLRVYSVALDEGSIARAYQESQPGPPVPVMPPSLLARVTFDGVIRDGDASYAAPVFRDATGRGLDAVPAAGDSVRPVRVTGVYGGAVALGVSESGPLRLPLYDGGPQWAPLNGSGGLSVSAWLSPNDVADWQAALVWPLASEAKYGFTLLLAVGPRGQSVGFSAASLGLCVGNTSLAGKWSHVTGVFERGDGLRVYVDGVEVAACADTSDVGVVLPPPEAVPSTTPWRALHIGGPSMNCTGEAEGAMCIGSTASYAGLVDDVRVYATPLTADAISAAAATPDSADPPPPVLHVGFDAPLGSTVVQDGSPLRRPPAQLVGDAVLTAEAAVGSAALSLSGAGGATLGVGSALASHFGDSSGAELSTCMWLQPTLPGRVGRSQTLLSMSDGNASSSFSVEFEWSGISMPILTATAFLSDGSTATTCRGGGAGIEPKRWHHVCWAFNGYARRGTFYVDGSVAVRCPPDGSSTFGAGAVSVMGSSGWSAYRQMVVGGVDNGGSSPAFGWVGLIDDVWIWPVELTPIQAARHFSAAASAGRGGWQDGLAGASGILAWYRFDDSLGSRLLRDESPLAAHAAWRGEGAGTVTTGPGVLGTALPSGVSFDVPIDMLRFAPQSALFSAWVLPDYGPGTIRKDQAVVHWAQDAWRPDEGAALALVITSDGAVRMSAGDAEATSSAGLVAAGTWVHVAGSWRGDGAFGPRQVRVYVNGVSAAVTDGMSVPAAASEMHTGMSTAPLRVGRAGWQTCGADSDSCIPLSGALDDVVIAAEADAALVAALYRRGTIDPSPAAPKSGVSSLTAPATAAAVGDEVDSIACEWPHAFAVAARPGPVPTRGVFAVAGGTLDQDSPELRDRRVRIPSIDAGGWPTAPSGWTLPDVHPGASVAALGNTVAVSDPDTVGIYTRDIGAGTERLWTRRQVLRPPREIAVLDSGQATVWAEELNTTLPREAVVGFPAGPPPPDGWCGVSVQTGGRTSRLGVDLGRSRRVVRITAGSLRGSWLQGFSLFYSTESTVTEWLPYVRAGVHHRFLLPVVATEPYRFSFAIDPPLVARHLLLKSFEAVNDTANLAFEVHVESAEPLPDAAPAVVALGSGHLYAATRDGGSCPVTGEWTSSDYLLNQPRCTPSYGGLGSSGGWCAAGTDLLKWRWLQLDLGRQREVTATGTRPRQTGSGGWAAVEAVTEYRLRVANASDGDWYEVGTYLAEAEGETWHAVPAVVARYVRWVPVTYSGYPSMRAGVRVSCGPGEGSGALTAYKHVGDGWSPVARLSGPVVALSAGPSAAAAVARDASGVFLLRMWRGAAALAGEEPLPELADGAEWTAVSISDNGGATAVVSSDRRLLMYHVRHSTLTLEIDQQLRKGCGGSIALTNGAGARSQESRVLFVACEGGRVDEYRVRRGAMTRTETLAAGAAVTALSARYGALCAAAPPRVVAWAPAAATAMAGPLSAMARSPAVSGATAGVVQVAGSGGSVLFTVKTAASEDIAVHAGDGMAERCEPAGGSLWVLPAAAARRLGSSAPVYLSSAAAVVGTTTGTQSGIKIGYRVTEAATPVALPAGAPVTGDSTSAPVAAVDSLEGKHALLQRPGDSNVQYVVHEGGAWRSAGQLTRMPPPASFKAQYNSSQAGSSFEDGYGGSLAMMREGIGFVGIPDDCSGITLDRCGGVLGYAPTSGGGSMQPVLRLRPPSSGNRRFGASVAAVADADGAGGYLVVAEDGSGESVTGRLHLYRVRKFTPQGRAARTDESSAEGGGLRVSLENTTVLTNCTYSPPEAPITVAAAAGGVVVVCPGQWEGSGASLRLFDLVDDGAVGGAKLLRRWERRAPDGASLGATVRRTRSSAPSVHDTKRYEAPALRVDDVTSFNGTGGPTLITLNGPSAVTVVGRFQVDSFYSSGAGGWGMSGLGGDLALFAASDDPADLAEAGAAEGGYCALRDLGRRIVCSLGDGTECSAFGIEWPTGTPAAFAVRFVADPSDSTGAGEITLWTTAKPSYWSTKRATCTGHVRWGAPGAPVPLKLGAGLKGSAGPFYLWRAPLTDSRVEALLQQLSDPDFVIEEDPTPTWLGGEAYANLYTTIDCTGNDTYVSVPLTHSEGRCEHCWDACGKQGTNGDAIATVQSVKVFGDASGAVAGYRLENEGITFIGCYTDTSSNRDLSVYIGNATYTVATCALACVPYAYFGLQDGQCRCGNTYANDATDHVKLETDDCGIQCPRETAEASTLLCGKEMVNAVYQLDAGCVGQSQDSSRTVTAVTYARPSDGCVPMDRAGIRHVRLFPPKPGRPRAVGSFAAAGALAMNSRVVVAGDAAEGAAWVWRRSDGELVQAIASPEAAAEKSFGGRLSLFRDTLVATASFVPHRLAPESSRTKPFTDTAAGGATYSEMTDGTCTSGFAAIATAEECWTAGAALSLSSWGEHPSIGAAEGTYGASYPQGCYYKESSTRLHFNRIGDSQSTDTDRRAICKRVQRTTADVTQLGGDFFASGAAYVYKMSPSGTFSLATALSDAAAHNTTRRWADAAATAKGVLAAVSVGSRTALVHYPQDCACSGRGACESVAGRVRCRCADGLDGEAGVNCGSCPSGGSWNGSTCVAAPCAGATPCSGHGACGTNGACACNPGWGGALCAEALACEDLLEASALRFECP